MRADQLLVQRGLAESRARARAEIDAGNVVADGKRVEKPSERLPADCRLAFIAAPLAYVSRGGVKLDAALDHFAIDVEGLVVLDIGASTGGFTDCVLRRGARKVYAVDVGRAQLHDRLRCDRRVVVMEERDARGLKPSDFAEPPGLVSADVSFVGLAKVLPAALELAGAGAWLVGLVKPQFEVGRAGIGKGGIVRDAALQCKAVDALVAWIDTRKDWRAVGTVPSPIRGGDGNAETFVVARKTQHAQRHVEG